MTDGRGQGPMEMMLKEWEGEGVMARFDASADAWMFIALHDLGLGPADGGTRIAVYKDPTQGLREALGLARGMTRKWAYLNVPISGGKAVLALSRPLSVSARASLLHNYARMLNVLNGAFTTAEDLGMRVGELRQLAELSEWVVGIPDDVNPDASSAGFTALGVAAGAIAALTHVHGVDGFAGRVAVVQGAGKVGSAVARRLSAAGLQVVIADLNDASARSAAAAVGGTVVSPDELLRHPGDLLVPCAKGGLFSPQVVSTIRCRIVVGAANDLLTDDGVAEIFHESGILYVPDFVANAGGALAMRHLSRSSHDERRVAVERIGPSIQELLKEAQLRSEPPLRTALRRVEQNLSAQRAQGRGSP